MSPWAYSSVQTELSMTHGASLYIKWNVSLFLTSERFFFLQ